MTKNKAFTAQHTCKQKDCKTTVVIKGSYCTVHNTVNAAPTKGKVSDQVENIRKSLFDKPDRAEGSANAAPKQEEEKSSWMDSFFNPGMVKGMADYIKEYGMPTPDEGDTDSTSYTDRIKSATKEASTKAKEAVNKAKAAAPKADIKQVKEKISMKKMKDVFGKVTGAVWTAAKAATGKVVSFVKKHAAQTTLALACVAVAAPFVGGMTAAIFAGTGLYALVQGVYSLVGNRYFNKDITATQYGVTVATGFLYAAAGTFTFMFLVPTVLYALYTATVYAYAYGSAVAYFIMI